MISVLTANEFRGKALLLDRRIRLKLHVQQITGRLHVPGDCVAAQRRQ